MDAVAFFGKEKISKNSIGELDLYGTLGCLR